MASDLGMHCLPMSHNKDARLIRVNAPLGFNFEIGNWHITNSRVTWHMKNYAIVKNNNSFCTKH